jgi:hypothetical protein
MVSQKILNPDILNISKEYVDKINRGRSMLIIFLYLVIGIGSNYFKFTTGNSTPTASTSEVLSQFIQGEEGGEVTYKTSFDCSGNLANVEKLICSNPSIANLDLELSQKFELLKSNQDFVVSQREWIRERNRCQDVTCLYNIYQNRLKALQYDVTTSQDNVSYEIARKLANESKYEEAYEIWLPLAKSGDSKAQMGLAKLFLRGDGVERDYTLGFYWTEKAAQQNNAEAQNYLGRLYRNGDGTSVNLEKSEYWFRKAEENGYRR